MEDTVITQEPNETPKTFTQDDVNRIVQERLIKDRKDRADYDDLKAKAEKYDALEEASKTELQRATEKAEKLESELNSIKRANEIDAIRREVESETGVPASLLYGEDKETCLAQACKIMEFHNAKDGYPSLKDAGEPNNKIKGSAKQQFAEWLNQS